jgi:Na+-translocating ferredoxin:NAD+ oxidoreductase RnfG subunit
VRYVQILAFHEPLDYLPTNRWYQLFSGKSRSDGLRLGRDIDAISGATLSARAATEGVRRALAYYEVLLSI